MGIERDRASCSSRPDMVANIDAFLKYFNDGFDPRIIRTAGQTYLTPGGITHIVPAGYVEFNWQVNPAS